MAQAAPSAPGAGAGRGPARPDGRYLIGVALAVAAVGFIAASDAFAKALAAGYDTVAIVFYRALVGGALLGLAMARARRAAQGGPLVAAPWLQLVRGLFVTAAAFLFFWGLARAPLADALALTASAPIFMALFGWAALDERPGPWLGPLVLLGAAGVALIARPHGHWDDWAPCAAIIASSMLYAGVCVLTRAMAGRDRPETTAFLSYAVMAVGAGIAGAWTGIGLPTLEHLPVILGLGLSGALGMAFYAHAYAHAGVANLAPWDNVVFLWGLAFGAIFFGERPDPTALAGGGLIMASGFLAALLVRR